MAGEDRAYTDWLRVNVACQAPLPHECKGVEIHHPTHLRHTGHDGRRAHDHFGVRLCLTSHVGGLHGLAPNGGFGGYRKREVQSFCEEMAAENRARYEGRGPGVALSALAVEMEF